MTDQTDLAAQAFARPYKSQSQVSVAAGRKGFKAELEDLRERMRKLGLGGDEVAGEIARRYRLRPRQAYRLARGWSLNHAAARFNALAASIGTDPQARAGMTGPHLCEHERWPDGGRRPSVYVLLMLAQMYETDALCLLDLTDHENLAPHDRLTLIRRPNDPFGRSFLAASTGYAAGTIGQPSADSQGLLLTLPYMPGRLVIEISDPAANASPPIAGTDCPEPVGRQLALVHDLPG
jgi:hypothetical protein